MALRTRVAERGPMAGPQPRRTASASRVALATLAALLAGCASLPQAPPRLAGTPLACMRATVAAKVPAGLYDKLAHCLAGGMIARYCSVGEAKLASWGKEARDAVGSGDADRRDLDADYFGIECARTATDDEALRRCCEARYPPRGPSDAAAPEAVTTTAVEP